MFDFICNTLMPFVTMDLPEMRTGNVYEIWFLPGEHDNDRNIPKEAQLFDGNHFTMSAVPPSPIKAI